MNINFKINSSEYPSVQAKKDSPGEQVVDKAVEKAIETSTQAQDESNAIGSYQEELQANNPYKTLFKADGYDFSNMSTNELYDLVKTMNQVERDSSKDLPHGSVASDMQSDMVGLETTLKILSFGGSIDPNEKIDIREYFTKRLETSQEKTAQDPLQYRESASHGRRMLNIVEYIISDEGFSSIQDKAAALLADKNKNLVNVQV